MHLEMAKRMSLMLLCSQVFLSSVCGGDRPRKVHIQRCREACKAGLFGLMLAEWPLILYRKQRG